MASFQISILRRPRRVVFAALLGAILSVAVWTSVFASNPHAVDLPDYGSCGTRGQSSFVWGSGAAGSSYTGYRSGSCSGQYDVHAYFLGSDSQWHYLETQSYSSPAQVTFYYWTGEIYGYHKYPYGSSNTADTHAY